jgi:hypothetical protein
MKCKINFDQENGSVIEWISGDKEIKNLVPFIQSIHCDGGEEIEELYGGHTDTPTEITVI